MTEPPPTASRPPKPSAASLSSSHTVTSRPAASPTSTACSASQAGVFRLAGTVARARERQPAPPRAMARASSSSAPSSSMSASTMRATGRSCGPVERQWKEKEASIAPTTKAPRPSSGAIAARVVTTLARSLVARATAAPGTTEVGDRPVADADQQDQRHVVVAVGAADRDDGDLTGATGATACLERGQQVDAEGVAGLVGTGSEERSGRVGEDREGPHLARRRSGAAGPGSGRTGAARPGSAAALSGATISRRRP